MSWSLNPRYAKARISSACRSGCPLRDSVSTLSVLSCFSSSPIHSYLQELETMSAIMDVAQFKSPLLLNRTILCQNSSNVSKPALHRRLEGISSRVFNNVFYAAVSIKHGMKTTVPRKVHKSSQRLRQSLMCLL